MTQAKNLPELLHRLQADGVPESEYHRHIGRFLELKSRERGVPLHAHFELTPLCNLDCKMCYVHLDGAKFAGKKLLPVEVWKELADQAHRAGMLYVSLTGGECLTYPDFDALYLYLWKMGIRINVLSNGVLMDEARVDFFKRYPPREIQITLYGSSDDAYEKVTGKRAFTTVMHNLKLLKDADLPVKLAITPNRFMADDMLPLLELAESLDIPYNINTHLIPPRKETGREIEDFSTEQYVEIYREQRRLKNWDMTPIDPAELPDENREGEAVHGMRCGAGKSSCGIRYDGALCPCLSLSEVNVDALNLGFAEAWRQINAIANNYPVPAECTDCAYAARCLTCTAMHKNAPQAGHCDPRICERAKAMIAAGIFTLPEQK